MAQDLVAPCTERCGNLRVVVVNGGVQKRRCRQLVLVQRLQKVPYADPVAPVAPAVVDNVGLGLACVPFRAQSFTEWEGLDINGDVYRQTSPIRPVVNRALNYGRIRITTVLSESHRVLR